MSRAAWLSRNGHGNFNKKDNNPSAVERLWLAEPPTPASERNRKSRSPLSLSGVPVRFGRFVNLEWKLTFDTRSYVPFTEQTKLKMLKSTEKIHLYISKFYMNTNVLLKPDIFVACVKKIKTKFLIKNPNFSAMHTKCWFLPNQLC
jgi:hypothetical protein